MAARDTALLGEILSVQKAILSRMIESEKRDSLKEKETEGGTQEKESKSKTAGFAEMQKELQNLNSNSKEQLDSIKELTKISSSQAGLQKSILDQILKQAKENSEEAKRTSTTETIESPSFKKLMDSIEGLTQVNRDQLDTLKRIEKKLVGGAAAGGGSSVAAPNKAFTTRLGDIGQALGTVGDGLLQLVKGLLAMTAVTVLLPVLLVGFGTTALIVWGLSKIFKNLSSKEFSDDQKNGAVALRDVTKSLFMFMTAMTLITPLAILAIPGMLATRFVVQGAVAILDDLGSAKEAKQAKEGADALSAATKALFGFVAKMALIMPLALLAVPGIVAVKYIVTSVGEIMKTLGSPDFAKDVEKGYKNVREIGRALGWFTLAVVLSGLALATVGLPALIVIGVVVSGVGLIMKFLGSPAFGNDIEKGYNNVRGMGKALAWFTLGIVITSIGLSAAVNAGALATFAIASIAMSVLFNFLGSNVFGDNIEKGTKNVRNMGVGLAVFSLALIVTGAAMLLVDFSGLAKLALGLAIVGGAFFLIGKGEKQIQKGTEVIKDLVKGMAIFTLALLGTSLVMMIVPMEGMLKFAASLAIIAGLFALIGMQQVESKVRDGAGVVRTMSGSMALFTLAVAASAIVMTMIPFTGVLKFVMALGMVGAAFALLGLPVIEPRIRDGVGVSRTMALHMIIFAGALYVTNMVMEKVGGMKNLLVAAGSIVVFGIAFAIVGAFDKTIRDGAKAMAFMALGMAAFGLGLIVLMAALKKASEISSGDLLKGSMIAIGAMVAFTGIFLLAGMFKSQIIGGALAMAAVGLGLAVFGLGLTIYLSGIAKILGVGGAGAMGGTQLKGTPWETVGSMLVGLGIIAVGAVTMVLYGTIFALAGQFEFGIPMMIVAGAIAFAAVGLGLIVFGYGLDKYLGVIQKYSGVTENEKGLKITADSFIGGLAIMGGSLGYLIGFGGIFALAGLASPLIILGAVAMATAGLALTSIGMGVKSFMENVPPGSDVGSQLNTLLSGIKDAFLSFVGAENPGGGFFGSVKALATGVVTGSTLFFAMATALMIGPVLSSIAQGVGAWANLSQIPAFKGYDKDGNPIFDEGRTVDAQTALENIKEYLPSLVDPFIEISKKANLNSTSGGSLMSFLVGTDLAKTPFELGISAAGGIGKVLSSVAQGVGAWANLQNIPRIKGYDKDGNPIFDESKTADVEKALDNITTYMPGILQPFIDIGNNPAVSAGPGSILSLLVGNDFGRTPFQRGIAAAADIGKVLSNVAQGVGAWANLENIPKLIGYDKEGNPKFSDSEKVNLDSALQNINKALSVTGEYSVISPFIDLANNPAVGAGQGSLLSILVGNDFGRTPFQRGISAAGDIGKVLSSIAQGIGAFANLQNIPKVIGYDSKGQPIYSKAETANVEKALENIKMLFGEGDDSIIDPFLRIAEKNSSIPSLLSLITGANIGATPFERGISAAGQIGAVLSSVAQGIGSFASLQSIPKLTGYDQNGQPLYEATQANVAEAVKQFQQLFGTDGDLSIIKPFVTLGEYITDSKPFSYAGAMSKMITGEWTGSSPVEKGIALGMQLGEIISNVASGIGIFANLSAIPVIKGYDDKGRPIYGEPVDGTKSVLNLGAVMKDLITAFADASIKLEGYEGDPEQATGVGRAISSILGSISESLSIFSNPDKIKKIKGYDKDGKPIYYENEFVKLDDVVNTIGQVLTRVLGAISNETVLDQIESLNESLGDNPELIGKFLGGFTDPMKKFAEIQASLEDKNLDTLTWRINAATAGLSLSIGNNLKQIGDFSIFSNFGSAFKVFADDVAAGYTSLFKIDQEGKEFYSEAYGVNSGILGVTTSIENLVGRLVQTFGVTNSISQITDAANTAKDFGAGIANAAVQFQEAFTKLFSVDSLGAGLYGEYQNSALWGIAEHIKYSVTSIVSTYTRDNTPEQIASTLSGSALMNQTLENLLKFPDYMKLFLSANPKQFGEDSKTAFDGLFTITTINPKDADKRSHLKQFTDEILRLASAADPFTKFASSFGKMAKDMRVFAENFSLMQPDGIFAFKEWTTSLITLSSANPTTFAANVTTANNAINAAYSSADNTGVVNTAVGAAKGPSLAEKKTAIEKQTAGKNVPPQQPQIDYVKLANAIATAIKFPTTMDVNIIGNDTKSY